MLSSVILQLRNATVEDPKSICKSEIEDGRQRGEIGESTNGIRNLSSNPQIDFTTEPVNNPGNFNDSEVSRNSHEQNNPWS